MSARPVAAVVECGTCGDAYVLRVCVPLMGGDSTYAYYPDCSHKGAKRKDPPVARRDRDGNVVRIPVASSDE